MSLSSSRRRQRPGAGGVPSLHQHRSSKRSQRLHLSTSFTSLEYGKRAVLQVLEHLLYRYPQHPEAKSLGSNGRPCDSATRGLLRRPHIIAGKHRRIGKDSDRRWEEASTNVTNWERASENLIRKIKKIGIRELILQGLERRILGKICRRQPVNVDALREYERKVKECSKN